MCEIGVEISVCSTTIHTSTINPNDTKPSRMYRGFIPVPVVTCVCLHVCLNEGNSVIT